MAISRVGSFLEFLFRRKRRIAREHQIADELSWHRQLQLPPGLQLTWLGTSGFALEYQGHTVLIDPYTTRVPLSSVVRRRKVAPVPDLAAPAGMAAADSERWFARADAILIGHSHFDHAMDTPTIARMSGARVYGSRSTDALMRAYGLGEQSELVEPYKVYPVGPFELSFVPSVHSKLVLGLTVPYRGDISCEHFDELTAPAYKCGDVFGILIRVAGVTLYHQGSADLIDDARHPEDVDIFLAGIAGRAFARDYVGRILGKLSPRVIVPHHFDDFFKPLDAPLEFSFNVNLCGFVDEVAAVSRDFTVAVPTRLRTIGSEVS